MNIKYISLLSFAFVAGINAMSPGKKLETTKSDLRKCQQSFWRFNCDEQERAYNNAKSAFMNPLYVIEKDGYNASLELQNTIFGFKIPMREATKQDLFNKKLDAYAASAVIEQLTGATYDNTDYYKYSNDSLENFCNNVLDEKITQVNRPSLSNGKLSNVAEFDGSRPTWATKMMGTHIDVTHEELQATKERMMTIIKKMSS